MGGRTAVFILIFGLSLGEDHILMDTTKESMLDWARYPRGPHSPTPGWVEERFTNVDQGINWRAYVVCDVGYPNVNNWLWTPFIERGEANRIYIEIKFSLRNCDLFPGTAVQCKENFSLLYSEFDEDVTPPLEPEAYKLIDRIAADEGRFQYNSEVIINTEVRSVEVNKKGIYFAFRDQGACLSLLAIKVYYKTCPEVTASFAKYPVTPTGSSEAAIEKVTGRCVYNAIPLDDEPFSFCKSDGTWLYSQGGCQCMAGYQADRSKQESCVACEIGRYKSQPGERGCDICPPYSRSRFAGSVECKCNTGYYRANSDPKNISCTRPPGPPRNLSVTKVGTTSLTLTWQIPRDEGGRADTVYRIHCRNCEGGVRYNPNTATFLQTFITLENLSPGTTYTLEVYSENGVSSLSRELPQSAVLEVRTKLEPPVFKQGPGSEISISEGPEDLMNYIATYTADSQISGDPQVYFELVNGQTEQTNNDETFKAVVNKDNQNQLDIYQAKKLVYERVKEYTLTIQVRNNLDLMAETQLSVKVIGDDPAPTSSIYIGILVALIIASASIIIILIVRKKFNGKQDCPNDKSATETFF